MNKIRLFISNPKSYNYNIQTFRNDLNNFPENKKEEICQGIANSFGSLKKLLLSWSIETMKVKIKETKEKETKEVIISPKKDFAKANKFANGIVVSKNNHVELYKYDQKERLLEEFMNHLEKRADNSISNERKPFLLYFHSPGNGKTAKLDEITRMAITNELHKEINQPKVLYPQLENCLAITITYNDKMNSHNQIFENGLYETDLIARNYYCYFYDLDASGSDCYEEFSKTFSIFFKHLKYKIAIECLIQDWKEFKKTDRDIFFISCIDELRILEDKKTGDLSRIQKVLEIVKKENNL
eukprot:TRINITY_DN6412_c0_g1_i1.p1 TRINITY_DN6412_c0_g1~~TRINITY_DN6412_c0_g1_i1.p1  ORF type:complete len:299 (+),score=69.07 TRINITY_DN6412_c0_g1_i1:88-984(+)